MDEVLVLDLVDSPLGSPKMGRLRKKRSREEEKEHRIQAVVNKFEFMQPDKTHDELYVMVEENDEYVARTSVSVLAQCGMLTAEQEFQDVFEELVIGNDFNEFVENESSKRKLGVLWSMLGSFNQGSELQVLKDLWIRDWYDTVQIRRTYSVKKSEVCIACALKKTLTHCVMKIDWSDPEKKEILGFMGPHCYNFKFRLLLFFNCKLKQMVKESASEDFSFQTFWEDEMIPVLDQMAEASQKMKVFYQERAQEMALHEL